MTNYKAWKIPGIGEKPRWVIADENGKTINRNPTKDELKDLEEENPEGRGNYNITNTCDRCRKRGIIEKLVKGKTYREYRDGKSTGYWLCNKCYEADYHLDVGHSKSSRRTGDLNEPRHIFADDCQKLTKIWRSTISNVPVEDLNEKLNNHKIPIDHSYDSELGIPQTKGCLYSSKYELWSQKFDNEHSQIVRGFEFDNLILYCVSKDGKTIERLYIFPVEEILSITGISIYNNDSYHWYNKYRITDEEEIKKVNDIWKSIIYKKK